MLFTSIVFLYYFLPIVIIMYYILPKKFKNYILLLCSLFFYAWGEPKFVFLMIFSMIINYFVGLNIDKKRHRAKVYLIIGIMLNLFIIGYFKYFNFIVENINNLFNTSITVKDINLPIGISFFTFQAISYIIDVYKNNGRVQKNLANLMLYISFFPQLIAGPIVRYNTIDNQIRERKEKVSMFGEGINRFIIGLAKKILLANNMAYIADMAFDTVGSGNTISVTFAWIGALCYALQIYFDFSGYSDMAIGLGKMFGFEFLENFNYPYISKSISEFWRRWHISLGTWFRDYIYIPLGGNRCNIKKSIFNLSVVWFLTGLWHGANWTFVIWGCYFGVFIILEKYVLKNILEKINGNVRMFTTFILVIMGWVLFRADNLNIANTYFLTMFSVNAAPFVDTYTSFFISNYIPIFIIGLFFATPILKNAINKIIILKESSGIYFAFEVITLILLMYFSTAFILASDYDAFIYFNF